MVTGLFIDAFNWYGLILSVSIVLGVAGAYIVARHHGLEGDVIIDMIVICLPLAILGARTYYVVFDSLAGRSWTFAEFCGFSGGEFKGLSGLAIYGGLIGGLIGAGIFHIIKNRKSVPENKRVSFWQIVDVGFVFIALGQMLGRWGNFANNEVYGGVIANPALQWSPIAMKVGDEWRMSIWFYESVWNFFGFLILLFLYLGKRKSFDGFVFAVYGIHYGIGRSWIESIREKDVLMLGDMRVSVLVSVLFIIGGIAIIATHIVRAARNGKSAFIFIDKKQLCGDYFDYEKTKLAHPMPDIVFFKDWKKQRRKEEIIVDSSGVAIKVAVDDSKDNDNREQIDAARRVDAERAEDKKNNAGSEDVYEDKWDE